jgi:penicillin-binding protein 1C
MLLIGSFFCLPRDLFKDPTATVITSQKNELLGAINCILMVSVCFLTN